MQNCHDSDPLNKRFLNLHVPLVMVSFFKCVKNLPGYYLGVIVAHLRITLNKQINNGDKSFITNKLVVLSS